MKSRNGFSLLELLIVVAIILIIAAIAIPRLLRTKMSANEASAASSLKEIRTANTTYYSSFGQGYAGQLVQLGPTSGGCATVGSGCADLLDSLLTGVAPATANPIKSGYRFTYYAANPTPSRASPNSSFAAVAVPVLQGNTGTSTFCVDGKQILRDTSGLLTTATSAGCSATWPLGGTVGPL